MYQKFSRLFRNATFDPIDNGIFNNLPGGTGSTTPAGAPGNGNFGTSGGVAGTPVGTIWIKSFRVHGRTGGGKLYSYLIIDEFLLKYLFLFI
jgi:hypothetical protein